MQLTWIRFKKYRRFSQEQTLRFSSKLTALVGPNESGKSSLLRLLSLIGHDEPFDNIDATRGEGVVASELRLEAAFFLDDSDRSDIADIPGGNATRWLKMTKQRDGSRDFILEPTLERDLTPRAAAARELKRALKRQGFEGHLAASNENEEESHSAMDVSNVLETGSQDLSANDIQVIEDFGRRLQTDPASRVPTYVTKLAETLVTLAELESQDHPRNQAIQRLMLRLPSFATCVPCQTF